MKSVMISIRPEWVQKILSGEKTLEVRKTIPNIPTPFKCYIYCTLSGMNEFFRKNLGGDVAKYNREKWADRKGNVVAEFICDSIFPIDVDFAIHDELPGNPVEEWLTWEDAPEVYEDAYDIEKATCLSLKEIMAYIGCASGCYCWNISNLKVYDKPKELRNFSSGSSTLTYKKNGIDVRWSGMKRPPQSWCYVDEEDD